MEKSRLRAFIVMYFSFFIFSLSNLISKLSSKFSFFSLGFIICLFVVFLLFGVYALIWQYVLKNVELSIAMANRPIVLVFTILWSVIFFNEIFKLQYIIGFLLILVGIVIIGLDNE